MKKKDAAFAIILVLSAMALIAWFDWRLACAIVLLWIAHELTK